MLSFNVDNVTVKPAGDHSDDGSDTEEDSDHDRCVPAELSDIGSVDTDEDILWQHRVKLYRFDTSLEPAEWKERGVGNIKILQHKTRGCVRLIMRRDQTLKICANHYIFPFLKLNQHASSDRSWVWRTPADFADEEPKPETFAVRFKDSETSHEFREQFNAAKILMEQYQRISRKNDADGPKEKLPEAGDTVKEDETEKLAEEVKKVSVK